MSFWFLFFLSWTSVNFFILFYFFICLPSRELALFLFSFLTHFISFYFNIDFRSLPSSLFPFLLSLSLSLSLCHFTLLINRRFYLFISPFLKHTHIYLSPPLSLSLSLFIYLSLASRFSRFYHFIVTPTLPMLLSFIFKSQSLSFAKTGRQALVIRLYYSNDFRILSLCIVHRKPTYLRSSFRHTHTHTHTHANVCIDHWL